MRIIAVRFHLGLPALKGHDDYDADRE